MTTRTITGNIKSLTDSAVATGTVTFEKLVTSATGSTIHQSGVTTATTDGSGDFSIDLAVPASGSYRYRMILPNGASFYFSIASGASVNVATLIVAETIEDSDAIVEALAAYLPLSGGTLTGQLNFSGTTHAGIKLLSLTTAQRDALTPANGMVIYNTTTATGQVYQGGAWVSVGAAVDVTALTTTTGSPAQRLRVAGAGGLEYRTTEQDLADLRDAGALATPDIGVLVASIGANTFTGAQNLADQLLTRPVIKDYGETVNALGNVTGTMTINLENGNYVTATLTGSVTVLAINNWPATGTLGSLTLELAPAGNTVVWTGVTWVGDEPTLGSTVDFVVLWSRTAGATIYAAHAGVTA